MPTAPFGAIKLLQRRTGADRATCKKALEMHDCDEDAAAAYIESTTEFKDSAAPCEQAAATVSSLGSLQLGESSGNTHVSVIGIEVGDGVTFPEYGDSLSVEYTGMLAEDGTQFDSSFAPSRGAHIPFSFRVGQGKVIKGWDEGIMKMSLGEKALLLIPSPKAYGPAGHGPIPPNADLKFEVRLVKITRQTSCLGAGRHGGVQRDAHEYADLAQQLLGRAPPSSQLEHRLPDDRQPMPLTSEMPA